MKEILCLAVEPWRPYPSRTQRFLGAFPDAKILYFEPPSSGAPSKDGTKAGRMTYLYTLPPIPAVNDQSPEFSASNHRRILRAILKAMNYHYMDHPLLWICSPVYVELVNDIPHAGLIYDCDRDWSELPILLESRLTCQADIVFAASPGLRDHLSPCSDNIVVVPNGIHFARYDLVNTEDLDCPVDMALCPRPVFGYTGTIWSNLNLSPVLAAAEAHRDWSFVFIGKVSRKNPYVKRLRKRHNVWFLGQKKASEVPAYLRHFTAGMMLLRDGMEDNDILSPRVYEYFAQGLPVAAMYHYLQKEVYPTLIDSAYSDGQFVQMCEKIIAGDPTEKKIQRHDIAAGADWSCRCADVRGAIEDSRLLDEMDLSRPADDGKHWFD